MVTKPKSQSLIDAAHAKFFETLKLTGDVATSCEKAGITIDYAVSLRRDKTWFAGQWDTAYTAHLEGLRQGAPTREERVRLYLATLANTGLMSEARTVSGLSWKQIVRLNKTDPIFVARVDQAKEQFADQLRKAALARGVHGVVEPKFHEGAELFEYERGPDGHVLVDDNGKPRYRMQHGMPVRLGVKKYSDMLLAGLLKANCPEFRETSRVELGNVPGETLQVGKGSEFDAARRIAFVLAAGLRSKDEARDNPDVLDSSDDFENFEIEEDDGSDLA